MALTEGDASVPIGLTIDEAQLLAVLRTPGPGDKRGGGSPRSSGGAVGTALTACRQASASSGSRDGDSDEDLDSSDDEAGGFSIMDQKEKSPLFLKRFHDAVSQADMRMSLRKSTGSVLTGSGKKKELDIFATEVSQ